MALKLAIVIHVEEEFDWHGCFSRANNTVSPQHTLINTIEKLLAIGAKITLAMDYAFVTSIEGKKVIDHFLPLEGESIEFAAHLHPWLTPPYQNNFSLSTTAASFPCNLTKELEFQKLKTLTDMIERVSRVRPVTYLAGRYGIGVNTHGALKRLGYKTDLSCSPYYDFTPLEGPNFSSLTCKDYLKDSVYYLPHTTAMTCWFSILENWLNANPQTSFNRSDRLDYRLARKLLGVRLDRLSPEEVSLAQMQRVFNAQHKQGQEKFIISFHSTSLIPGATPYTQTKSDVDRLVERLIDFITWFYCNHDGEAFLPRECNLYSGKLVTSQNKKESNKVHMASNIEEEL
ncbi:polysaccharide deacetylase family protein [Photobacterium sanguinicancri]|uniref:hypothetical protein n=1 Tax=Photobacterium sanguinicancri TaxID=875932 RepID=UPI0021C3D136|nr:hypothetical protein [Photobacterium sanguinicancri]